MRFSLKLKIVLLLLIFTVVFTGKIKMDREINDFQIMPDFNLREYASPDTGEVKIDSRLVTIVQLVRYRMGCKVIVTSGYRTPEHNHKVGGALESLHLEGLAVDVTPEDKNLVKLFEIAAEFEEVRGLGIYKNHVHIDLRQGKRVFWVKMIGKPYRYFRGSKIALKYYCEPNN